MPQSLIQLPKEAEFKIAGQIITISNRMVVTRMGLFDKILDIVNYPYSDIKTLMDFEGHGVSFEAAIECCANELEWNMDVITDLIYHNYYTKRVYKNGMDCNWDKIRAFSTGEAGRIIADQFIEKIRDCDNWEELYNEMLYTSKFTKDMKKKIMKEIENKTE